MTESHHGGSVAPNILDQVFGASAPDQKWGVDISYIWTAEGWLYLAIVLDLYSRRGSLSTFSGQFPSAALDQSPLKLAKPS